MALTKPKCDECSKVFANRTTLKTHLRIHRGERPFKCGHCGVAFPQQHHLQVHERIHTGEKPFACNLCPKTFTHKTSFLVHKRAHSNLKPYKCKICAYSANEKASLRRHEETHAKHDESNTGETFSPIEIQKLGLNRQRATELLYKCKSCWKSFSKLSSLRNHIKTHQRKTYRCNLCSFSAQWKSLLNKHERTHTREKSYSCKFCRFNSASRHRVIWHQRAKHSLRSQDGMDNNDTATEELTMKVENKSQNENQGAAGGFGDENNKDPIILNKKATWTSQMYKCKVCNYSSRHKGHVSRHEMTHTGEKPFKCRFCEYTANQKHNVVRHEGTHSESATSPKHSGSLESKSLSFSPRQVGDLSSAETSSRRRSISVTRFRVLWDGKQRQEDSLKPSLEQATPLKRQHVSRETSVVKSPALKSMKPRESTASVSSLGSIKIHNVVFSAKSNFLFSTLYQRDNKRFSYSICRICKLVAESEAEIVLHMDIQHRLPALSLVRVKFP